MDERSDRPPYRRAIGYHADRLALHQPPSANLADRFHAQHPSFSPGREFDASHGRDGDLALSKPRRRPGTLRTPLQFRLFRQPSGELRPIRRVVAVRQRPGEVHDLAETGCHDRTLGRALAELDDALDEPARETDAFLVRIGRTVEENALGRRHLAPPGIFLTGVR